MDWTVVVYADVEQQIERLILRDNYSREQALSRITSQMPLPEKRCHADYVIDNTGTREDTERQARELFRQLEEETKRI
jgi:dephospho-CoA kinase